MSTRAADTRFLLPRPASSVVLLGARAADEAAWAHSGLILRAADDPGRPDLVVTDGGSLGAALALGAHSLIVHPTRGADRALIAQRWHIARYSVTWGQCGPILIATPTPTVQRYVDEWAFDDGVLGRARRRIARLVTAPRRANLIVATRAPSWPEPLAAAAATGVSPPPGGFFMFLGTGNERQRPVAFAFARGASTPAWIVKWTRLPDEPSRGHDESSVRAAVGLDPVLGHRVPRTLGRAEVGGRPAVVETAAIGRSMNQYVRRSPPARSIALGERVLDWICQLSARTRTPTAPAAALTGHDFGPLVFDAAALASRIGALPAVVAHNDLGTVNVVTDGRDFSIIDWEDARLAGLPMTDAVCFVTDLLATMHGPRGAQARAQWCCALWRGDLAQSPFAFRWMRAAAAAAGLSDDAAGALVVVSWLRAAHSPRDREYLASGGEPSLGYYRGAVAELWLADPRLGVHWRLADPDR